MKRINKIVWMTVFAVSVLLLAADVRAAVVGTRTTGFSSLRDFFECDGSGIINGCCYGQINRYSMYWEGDIQYNGFNVWYFASPENDREMTYIKATADFSDEKYRYNYQHLRFCSGVFENCGKLRYADFGNISVSLDEKTFCGCRELTCVRLGQTDVFGIQLFNGFDHPQNWTYTDNHSIIRKGAFTDCPMLGTVIIDGKDTEIEQGAFENCGSIEIYCPKGSKAEEYALLNNIPYVIIPEMTELESCIFDEKMYASNISECFSDNEGPLYAHWLEYGLKNGASASRVFDADTYLAANRDVAVACGGDRCAAYRHFLSCGINELRKSSPEYNGSSYKMRYPDLGGMSGEELLIHYIKYGASEGRKAVNGIFAGKYGDADGDGIVTAADSAYVLQKALKNTYIPPIESVSDENIIYMDTDGDGYITANDSACIMQKTLRNGWKMPVEIQG